MNKIVIYDANCGICTYLANNLKRMALPGSLQFIPNDSLEALQLATQHSIEDLNESVFLIDSQNEKIYNYSSAFIEIMKNSKIHWRLIALILSLPLIKQLTNQIYNYISKKRSYISKIFGLTECSARNFKLLKFTAEL